MRRTKTFPQKIEKQAIYNYIVNKQGLQTAGREFGISQPMMEQILKKYSIPKRTYSEAKQGGRKYPCDDNFFKRQSHEMAYVLGFIAANGCVSSKENRISIEVQESDRQILERIKEVTKVTRPITIQLRKNGKRTAMLRNWSSEWKSDLAHYGVTNKKTLTLKPPTMLAPEYRIDYIRGYFDGDGSICSCNNKSQKGYGHTANRFEIAGTSKQAMEWIYLELIRHYHIMMNALTSEKLDGGVTMYKVRACGGKELRAIYNLFYSSEGTMCLLRKKEKFETILNTPRDSNSSDEE